MCNVAKLVPPVSDSVDVDQCSQASGNSAFERPHSIRNEDNTQASLPLHSTVKSAVLLHSASVMSEACRNQQGLIVFTHHVLL